MDLNIHMYEPAHIRIMAGAMIQIAEHIEQNGHADVAAPEAPAPDPTGDPGGEMVPPVDDNGIVKLGRSDHKKWADHFIEVKSVTHQDVYEALSANQRKRVDEALGLGGAGSGTQQTSGPSEKELRDELQGVLKQVAEIPDDTAKKTAVGGIRAHFEQILNEQGTEFEKPSQSLIHGDRLAGALEFAKQTLANASGSPAGGDDDDPFA